MVEVSGWYTFSAHPLIEKRSAYQDMLFLGERLHLEERDVHCQELVLYGAMSVSCPFQSQDQNPRVFSPSVLSATVRDPHLLQSQTRLTQKVALLGRCPDFNRLH